MGIFPFLKKNQFNRDLIHRVPRPVALIVMDGYGISPIVEGNAVTHAHTPNLDFLETHYVKTLLHSSGNEVGLPYGEFGNSEVGHLNLGAGRIVYQPLLRVSRAIEKGGFNKNPATDEMLHHLKKTGGSLQMMCLVSAGGVHAHIEHLLLALDWAKEKNVKKISLHLITDGRDSQPASAESFLKDIEEKMKALGGDIVIASVSGRYFAMDRDKAWERTAKAYKAMLGTSTAKKESAREIIASAYAKSQTDEFIEPVTIVDKKGKPVGQISDGDALMCLNFRPDRMRQIVSAFVNNRFQGFKVKNLKKFFICSMTEYDPTLKLPVIFPEENIKNPLAAILSKHKLKQFHIAETQKYPHVTYFFNGGQERPFPGESRTIVPSLKVSNFDKAPQMSAPEICEAVLKELEKKEQDFYVMNFANPDMVAHTGDFKATLKGISIMDACIGKIVKKILELDGAVFITSDHGNAEEMINFEAGGVDTEHNIYPVPLILVIRELARKKPTPTFRDLLFEPPGTLADVAPTILDILNIKRPEEMTGISLLNTMK